MDTYILFDIGGTKTRVAISNDLVSFKEPIKFDTPKDYKEGLAAIEEAVKTLTEETVFAGVCGGIRGPLNPKKTELLREKILTDWVGKDIAGDLEKIFGSEVILENDASLATLGEAHFGAGKDYHIVAYHTVSTGVGGARVVDGVLESVNGSFEPGKQILDIDESILQNGEAHTLENLISGTSLEKRRGVKPYEIPQSDVVWDQLASYLARGLINTISYWSPDVIVLGGSMIVGDPRILLEDIERHTKTLLEDTQPCPVIVDALLADEGGLYGAMALLQQKGTPQKGIWARLFKRS